MGHFGGIVGHFGWEMVQNGQNGQNSEYGDHFWGMSWGEMVKMGKMYRADLFFFKKLHFWEIFGHFGGHFFRENDENGGNGQKWEKWSKQ